MEFLSAAADTPSLLSPDTPRANTSLSLTAVSSFGQLAAALTPPLLPLSMSEMPPAFQPD